MSGGVGTTGQVDRQMYAQWVAAMMAQDTPGGPVGTASTVAPTMAGDSRAAGAAHGQAAPSINLGQPVTAAPQAPPDLGFDGQGRVMVLDTNQPYLGMDIRVAGRPDAAGQWVPDQPVRFTDAQGNTIDLDALEQAHGYGVQAPATNGAPAAAAPQAPGLNPEEPVLDMSNRNAAGFPKITYPDGRPYQGKELYFNEQTQQIVDAQNQAVDPNSLGLGPVANEADQATVRKIKTITTIAGGAIGVGMDYMWYRSTLPGMQSRLTSMTKASQAFQAGTSLQAKMANTPVIGSVVRRMETSRQGKIETLTRSIKVANMTPKQEALLLSKERLATLKAESKAFRSGQSMMGKMQNKPVVGGIAKGVESRRQAQIGRLQAEIRTGAEPSAWTRVKNASRGKVMPALMLASDGYSVYKGIKHWNDPGNDRKWDDALRIAGSATSAAGDIMAFKKGNIKAAIATHAAGLVINTVGSLFNDLD